MIFCFHRKAEVKEHTEGILFWKHIRKNHHIYIPSAGYFAGKRTTFSPISIWYPLLFKSPHSLTTVCQRSKRPLYIYVLSMLHLCGYDCYMAIAHVKNHYILLILLHTNTKCSQGKKKPFSWCFFHPLNSYMTHITLQKNIKAYSYSSL